MLVVCCRLLYTFVCGNGIIIFFSWFRHTTIPISTLFDCIWFEYDDDYETRREKRQRQQRIQRLSFNSCGSTTVFLAHFAIVAAVVVALECVVEH